MKSATKLGLLGATFLTAVTFGLATPAAAQDATDTCPPGSTPAADGTCEEEDEAIVVTGSRLRTTAFTSSSPVGVITAEDATLEGLASAAEIIQQTPATGGAFQVNTQLTGFVATGGPGVNTISLRGLGAERTLVLLNGHRLGPAGTRGTVGPIDLNVIPGSLIQRIEILKDGASSIYGSDAIAGVVNFITREDFDGIELNVYSNFNEWGGGEQQRINASWGTTWNGGYFNVGAEYYQQEVLRNRDRDDTACTEDYLFLADPAGHPGLPGIGERVDYPNIDPGQEHSDDTYKCFNLFTRVLRATTANGLMDMIYHDPGVNYAVPGNNSPIAGLARQARAGFPQTYPYAHQDAPAYGRISSISPNELTTIFATAGFDIGDFAELYGELMHNRRESTQYGARQFFPAVNTGIAGNTFPGQLLGATFQPIIPAVTDRDQEVNYTRALIGLRGDFGDTGWAWDVYVQGSHSDADYGTDIFFNDRVLATTARNLNGTNDNSAAALAGCNQAQITISGGNCADLAAPIPWSSARILNGDFNANERAFLMTHEVGNTTYDQRLIEASVTGPVFQLPAGSLEAAFGVSYREKKSTTRPALTSACPICGVRPQQAARQAKTACRNISRR
jgi:iron complex outermembrane recepter protein